MLRCLVSPELLSHKTIELPADEAHHLTRVVRARTGDSVDLLDGSGGWANASISDIQGKKVWVDILNFHVEDTRDHSIALFPALLKAEAMDWLIQKATELGVSDIYPMMTERSVIRLKSFELEKKRLHWLNISKASIKQCGNHWLPEIHPIQELSNLTAFFTKYDYIFCGVLSSDGTPFHHALEHMRKVRTAGCCIGPEGDFTEKEIEFISGNGTKLVNLGPRVLRAETASIYMISVLNFLLSHE